MCLQVCYETIFSCMYTSTCMLPAARKVKPGRLSTASLMSILTSSAALPICMQGRQEVHFLFLSTMLHCLASRFCSSTMIYSSQRATLPLMCITGVAWEWGREVWEWGYISSHFTLTNNVLFLHHSKINGLFGKCLNVLQRKILWSIEWTVTTDSFWVTEVQQMQNNIIVGS